MEDLKAKKILKWAGIVYLVIATITFLVMPYILYIKFKKFEQEYHENKIKEKFGGIGVYEKYYTHGEYINCSNLLCKKEGYIIYTKPEFLDILADDLIERGEMEKTKTNMNAVFNCMLESEDWPNNSNHIDESYANDEYARDWLWIDRKNNIIYLQLFSR